MSGFLPEPLVQSRSPSWHVYRLTGETTVQIDAHVHFWSLSRGEYDWLTPDLAAINRDFHPRDLRPYLNRHGIESLILVQAAASVAETDYMLGIADAADCVAGVVGWIDFEEPAHRRHLERFAAHPKFRGLRPMIQDIPAPDWMLEPRLDWAYRAMIEHELSFDALGFPQHLDNFLRLFARYPDLRVVVDHCMKPQIRDGAFDSWAAGLERIARETPAYCKLSGLVTEAKPGWTADDLKPYAGQVLQSFGPERVMWGSDWPVVTLAGTYDTWREAAEEIVGDEQGAAAIWGRSAATFYRLDAEKARPA